MTKKTLSDEEFLNEDRTSGDELPVARRPSRRRRTGYVPAYPLKIQVAIVKAKAVKALPLVMAIHRQLHMTKQDSVPLSGAIWDAAGCITRKEKTAALQKLKKLREVIRLTAKQTDFSYYRASKGPLWDHPDQE
jgi:hypothetical protein